MKKILFIFFLFISIFTINVFAKDYIYSIDEANILSDDTKDYIDTYSSFLKEESDINLSVVCVDSISNYDLDEYTSITYENVISNDKGLLILVSRKDRKIQIMAGNYLSDVVTSELIDKYIQDYFISFLGADDWDNGIKNGYTSFFKLLCNSLNVDTSGLEVVNGNDFFVKYKFIIFMVCLWICNMIGYLLPKYFIKRYKNKSKLKFIDHLIFYGSIFVNIIILYYSYIYNKGLMFVIVVFELFSIYSGNVFNNKKSIKKKKIYKNKK